MYYFAYGSNMSIARLKARVKSAVSHGCYVLKKHDLKFHKRSKDGSSKCDAFFTSNQEDKVYGILFEIDPAHKPLLDKAEGLGFGYSEKQVKVQSNDGARILAVTYYATDLVDDLEPYTWYTEHCLIGAREGNVPQEYIEQKIASIQAVEDPDKQRDIGERSIYN
ncbi:MAG: gamma-glutamylcyclotransferase [Gammaproteobacteria bacterium]|nr:gamma-glutamylcyclotransferase [Gammaproteobacteria bacterium]